MRPLSMMAMSVAVASTSDTMCVERMTMRSPDMSESRLRKRTRSSGSRPAVGSSTMSRWGSFEQRLRDAHALAHPPKTRRAAVARLERFTSAVARRCVSGPRAPSHAFGGGHVLQEFPRRSGWGRLQNPVEENRVTSRTPSGFA